MAKGLFITGTDTDIGKTVISAALCHGFAARGERVAALKPIAAGCEQTADGLRNADALSLMAAASIALPYATVNPYAFKPAIAPHLAAAAAGIEIDPDRIKLDIDRVADNADRVIVEGAGGWQVPMDEFLSFADLAELIGYPVILVVGMRLGCLNHALLSADAIYSRNVPIGGWIANCIDPDMSHLQENIETLKGQIAFPYLGTVPWMEHPQPAQVVKHIHLERIGSDMF